MRCVFVCVEESIYTGAGREREEEAVKERISGEGERVGSE